MTYSAQIIGPSGQITYLSRGREVSQRNATAYPHPSAARKAIDSYLTNRKLIGRVVKNGNEEWQEL